MSFEDNRARASQYLERFRKDGVQNLIGGDSLSAQDGRPQENHSRSGRCNRCPRR